MINVLADQYLYNIQSYLPENINLQLFDPDQGLPPLDTADALLIRTVIPINKQTVPTIPEQLSFVGTASAGTDHVDIPYLRQQNISFSDAAGCNARSVAEYIATALLLWSEKRNKDIKKLSAGIIGAGHVGTQVIDLLNKLDVSTVAYDPPRENREPDFTSAKRDDVLDCDILSFHTPLTSEGPYPTFHWLNAEKLIGRSFELILNSSRGGVVDEQALLDAKNKRKVGDIIIDVWENEPAFNLRTATKAFIKTPHIAGYSVQAKENASKQVADTLLNHFGIPNSKKDNQQTSNILTKDVLAFDTLSSLLTELHPIREYEKELQHIIETHPEERGIRFNSLRAEFPLRQEFSRTYLPGAYFDRFPILKKLSFSVAEG